MLSYDVTFDLMEKVPFTTLANWCNDDDENWALNALTQLRLRLANESDVFCISEKKPVNIRSIINSQPKEIILKALEKKIHKACTHCKATLKTFKNPLNIIICKNCCEKKPYIAVRCSNIPRALVSREEL
jgi:hypothetical protein